MCDASLGSGRERSCREIPSLPPAPLVDSGFFSTFLSNFAGLIPWEFPALPWLEAEEVARGVVLRRRGHAGKEGLATSPGTTSSSPGQCLCV